MRQLLAYTSTVETMGKIVASAIVVLALTAEMTNPSSAETCDDDQLPSRFDGDSMVDFLQLSLTCDDWLVQIRLSSCHASRIGIASVNDVFVSADSNVDVATLDDSCKLANISNSTYGDILTTSFSYDACEVTQRITSDYFKSYQYVLNYKTVGSTDALIVRRSVGQINLTCSYDWKQNMFLGGFSPLATSYDVSETVYGGSVAATKIRAFSDAELQYEMDSSDPYVSIPVKFYVTAELESLQPDMILQATALWATPTPDPNYIITFSLVSNGCPNPTLKRQGWIDVIENFESTRVVFKVRSFLWPPFWRQEIYFHCDLKICDQAAVNSSCTENVCPPRRKREIDDRNPKTITFRRRASQSFAIVVTDVESFCGSSSKNETVSECQDICSAADGKRVCQCFTGRKKLSDGTCVVDDPSYEAIEAVKVRNSGTALIAASTFTATLYLIHCCLTSLIFTA